MAYVKSKVNQTTGAVEAGTVLNGEFLNDNFLNHIQTQLDAFLSEYSPILEGWRLCFFRKTFKGSGNKIKVDGALIGNPVIFVNGVRYTSYERDSGPITGLEDFYYYRGTDEIYSEGVAINNINCVVFYYAAFPHNETHISGSSDPITINEIGGLTSAQISALFSGQVTAEEMHQISVNRKQEQSVLCIRKLSDGQGLPNEIYDIGPVL